MMEELPGLPKRPKTNPKRRRAKSQAYFPLRCVSEHGGYSQAEMGCPSPGNLTVPHKTEQIRTWPTVEERLQIRNSGWEHTAIVEG